MAKAGLENLIAPRTNERPPTSSPQQAVQPRGAPSQTYFDWAPGGQSLLAIHDDLLWERRCYDDVTDVRASNSGFRQASVGLVMTETFKKRLNALEEKAAQEGVVYTEAQLVALEAAKRKSHPDEIDIRGVSECIGLRLFSH